MLHTFEDLEVWKRSAKLAADINIAIHNHTNYALRDQISRSAISIPSNIAEGAERDSTNNFIRFLRISKGSCAELRTQLYINQKVAQETGANNLRETPIYIQETKEILAMLQGLIQKLQKTK
ncbi:four helix bundle protein [Rubritalea spongiae]|uniref:Four helix bundle protein n=1 Tax=Rubritalea spongiae TaxID=430797 RepID=A0ABW5E1S1_9BACT